MDAVAPRRLPAACCPNDRVIVSNAGIYSAGKLVPGDSRYEKMAEEPIGRFQVQRILMGLQELFLALGVVAAEMGILRM